MLGAKERATWRRHVGRSLLVGTTLVLSSVPGCKRDDPVAAPPPASPVPPPAPPPSDLALTAVIHDPDRVFGATRELFGSRGGVLASRDRVASIVVELGLPATVMEVLAPGEPVLCAVVIPEQPSFACSVRIRDPAELVTIATGGASPSFELRRDSATLGAVLKPVRSQPSPFALGLFRDHLVVATDERTLLALGPWLDQTFAPSSTSGGPSSSIDIHLYRDVVEKKLGAAALGAMARLPPDLGAVLDVKSSLDVIERVDDISIAVDVSAEQLHLVASSKVAGQPDLELGSGTLKEAFAAPAGAQAMIATFEGRDARTSSSKSMAPLVSRVVGDEDATALTDALSELASARGDRSTLSFELGARGPALFGDLAVADPAAVDHALGLVTEVLGRKSTKLRAHDRGYSLRAKKTVLERVGDVTRVRIAKETANADDREPPTIELLLRLDGRRLLLGGGYDAPAALDRVLGGPSLADEERVRDAVSRAPATASVVVFVDPAAIAHPREHRSSSALATMGLDPTSHELRISLDIDRAALDAILDVTLGP